MKPTLNIKEQVAIGFAHIRAGVTGGHDLRDAWRELVDMVGDDASQPDVMVGAAGCLLYLTEALERAGFLPVIEIADLNAFLHSGHSARVEAVESTMRECGKLPMARLANAMIACIAPHQDRITFAGNMPTVAPLV